MKGVTELADLHEGHYLSEHFFDPVRTQVAITKLEATLRAMTEAVGMEAAPKEIERTIRLMNKREQQSLIKSLKGQRTEDLGEAVYEQTAYEFKYVCMSVAEEKKPQCARMTARVRTITYSPKNPLVRLFERPKVEYHWTVKIKINDNEVERYEYEGKESTFQAAHTTLEREVGKLLGLSVPARLDTPSLRVKKTRRSFRFPPAPTGGREVCGANCAGHRVDIDTIHELDGKKLSPPLLTIDIEGTSDEQIIECKKCLGYGDRPEFSLRKWMSETKKV